MASKNAGKRQKDRGQGGRNPGKETASNSAGIEQEQGSAAQDPAPPGPESTIHATSSASEVSKASASAGQPLPPRSTGSGSEAAENIRAQLPAVGEVSKPIGWLLLVAVLVGLGFTTYLTRTHLEVLYGKGSFQAVCDFGEGFNCTDAITSPYSTLFGVLPLSVLAIPVYAVMIMLSLRGILQRDLRALGFITLLGSVSVALSAYLFYVSKFILNTFCPFCLTMYAVNIAAAVLPMWMARESFSNMLRHAFIGLGDRRLVALSAANLLFVGALAFGGYSAAKEGMLQQTITQTGGASGSSAAPTNTNTTANTNNASPSSAQAGPSQRDLNARKEVPIDDSIPFLGPADARVTIIAYEDFQCGFCKRLAGNLEELAARYPKDVRIGYRHFPMHLDCNEGGIRKSMHPDACRAAMASECARQQGQFWPYHDQLFKNSRNLNAQELQGYAQELGLNTATFDQCMRVPETLAKVKLDSRTGGQLGVSGTPTFFVNGRQFSGALPTEALAALVEAELKGQELTVAELREIKAPDITGTVSTPEMVSLDGPYGRFEMDAVEATIVNGKAVAKVGQQPSTKVTWFDADSACKAVGKRLCSEAEWLTACSGALPRDENGNGDFTDDKLLGTTYPYGENYRGGVCNDQVEAPKGASADAPPALPPLPTGNRPECRSKAGVFDLTGNVREWVGTVAPRAAFMGGAFYSRDEAACISRVESVGPFHTHEALGFRCCRGGAPTERVTHPGRQPGETLKPFTGTLMDGTRFNSESLKGHVTLLTFWASWCGPCRQELPAYAQIYPALEKQGFRILSINVDQDPAKAQAFLQQHPVNFPVLMDTDSSLLSSFDSKAMPTSFLLNEKGQILLRKTGFEKGDEQRLQRSVEKLLAAQKK
ncbi:MAG: vitamin K epoxide reductase family protein [Myxococcota bacterium]